MACNRCQHHCVNTPMVTWRCTHVSMPSATCRQTYKYVNTPDRHTSMSTHQTDIQVCQHTKGYPQVCTWLCVKPRAADVVSWCTRTEGYQQRCTAHVLTHAHHSVLTHAHHSALTHPALQASRAPWVALPPTDPLQWKGGVWLHL